MTNTMVTVHKSDNTCSVHFGNKRRTIISKTICKIRNVSVNKIYIYLSLSACKQVRHYIIHWMTALGDTLVFGCTLVEIVQLTHTDKYYPSPVHWIALCYMAFPKTKQSLAAQPCQSAMNQRRLQADLTCCWLTCHCPALIEACSSAQCETCGCSVSRLQALSGGCIYSGLISSL